jgi:hypothetical protein
MNSRLWVMTVQEKNQRENVFKIEIFKTLEGVQSYLDASWDKWRKNAEYDDEEWGPLVPSLQNLEQMTRSTYLTEMQESVLLADFGNDIYSVCVQMQLKYVYDS